MPGSPWRARLYEARWRHRDRWSGLRRGRAGWGRGGQSGCPRRRRRMGWSAPWVSSADSAYNRDWGWTREDGEYPGVSFYVRTGDDVFLTYVTEGRGVEPLSGFAGYLDRTVFGRQESWEDSPTGWPTGDPHTRNRRHDEYPAE
nr:DUF899 family protein [Actinokineospora spheciospongiae]